MQIHCVLVSEWVKERKKKKWIKQNNNEYFCVNEMEVTCSANYYQELLCSECSMSMVRVFGFNFAFNHLYTDWYKWWVNYCFATHMDELMRTFNIIVIYWYIKQSKTIPTITNVTICDDNSFMPNCVMKLFYSTKKFRLIFPLKEKIEAIWIINNACDILWIEVLFMFAVFFEKYNPQVVMTFM